MKGPSSRRSTLVERLFAEIWRQINGPGALLLALALAAGLALWGALGGLGLPPAAGSAASSAGTDAGAALWPAWPFRLGLAVLGLLALLHLLQAWVPAWVSPPAGRLHRLAVTCPAGEVARARALAAAGLVAAHREADGQGIATAVAAAVVASDRGPARWLRGALPLGVSLLAAVAFAAPYLQRYDASLLLTLGESQSLGQRGTSVLLDQIRIEGASADLVPQLAAHVTLQNPAWSGPRQAWLSPEDPARIDGTRLRLVGYGPAARVTARSADGSRYDLLSLDNTDAVASPLARVSFVNSQEQLLAVPEAGLVIHLIYYSPASAPGSARGALDVEVWRSSDGQLLSQTLTSEAAVVQAGKAELRITPEYAVTLQAAQEPLSVATPVALALILLGLAASLAWPERRVWLAWRDAEGAGPREGALWVPAGQTDAAWLACLVAVLKEEADEPSR